MTSIFCRWFSSHPQRYLVQWGCVNGKRIAIGDIAKDTAMKVEGIEGLKRWQVSCTAEFDHHAEQLDVSSLQVWMDTETHGRWALNKTTQVVKNILVEEYGGYIPWFKR